MQKVENETLNEETTGREEGEVTLLSSVSKVTRSFIIFHLFIYIFSFCILILKGLETATVMAEAAVGAFFQLL